MNKTKKIKEWMKGNIEGKEGDIEVKEGNKEGKKGRKGRDRSITLMMG